MSILNCCRLKCCDNICSINQKTNKYYKYCDIHRDIVKTREFKQKQEKYWYFAFKSAKGRSKERNIDFNLTLDYIKSIYTNICPIYNIEFVIGDADKGPALDRIDPNKGYVIGNVRFISAKANRLKSNMTKEDCLLLLQDFINMENI